MMKSKVAVENDKQAGKSVVVVGTCREVNYDWIVQKRLYNLPLPKGGKGESYSAVTHLVVYAADRDALAFKAKYAKDVDGAWLKENGYRLAKVPHAERYALFELDKKTTDKKILTNQNSEVYVCSTRWTGKITPEFFDKPLPQCGGKSVPNIFERLRPFFSRIPSACAFNPVQMDFIGVLDYMEFVDVPFPAPKKGKFTFIDLFAGIGGIRLGYQALGGRCVFSSEWDAAAAKTYYYNFGERPHGDIQKIDPSSIPDFDVLLAGFPCQPFSKWRIAS